MMRLYYAKKTEKLSQFGKHATVQYMGKYFKSTMLAVCERQILFYMSMYSMLTEIKKKHPFLEKIFKKWYDNT